MQKQVAKFGSYIHGKVLDAGSGDFRRYEHLFSADSVTHLDVFSAPGVDVVASLDSMPFSDHEFDSVLSTQVFEHIEYPEKAAAEIYRVLRPGGHVLVTVPQWNELHEEPHDFWRYTCFGIKSLFERHGFSTVAYEQTGGFFANRAKMAMRYLTDRFDIHNRKWSRLASFIFHIWGVVALWLDSKDTSVANRKHAIGWVFVFVKKKE